MNIGAFDHGWWNQASAKLGHACIELPTAQGQDGNPYTADVADRIANAPAVAERFADHPPDLLIDNGGTGLTFVTPGEPDEPELALLHETLARPLLSHFIDPVPVALQGLDLRTMWQSLASPSWIKMLWDKAQVVELRQMGVPNVIHLPMAAPDRDYDDTPVDPARVRPIVSFVGGQNSRYFTHHPPIRPQTQFAGTLAQALRADRPDATFYSAYHDFYGLAEPVRSDDPLETQVAKLQAYFNAKLFFNASLFVKSRDRFVIFLHRVLGNSFRIHGQGWDEAYGLPVRPSWSNADDYFRHFRETAVNINLVGGNAETGLNMRHFEITAAGGFMLSYRQAELEEHFVIGKECDAFSDEYELIEKVRYYLEHPEERAAIARAGQRRALAQHLYGHRLHAALRMADPSPPPVQYSRSTLHDDLKRYVPEARVILDCGANVGQMAQSFRHLYPSAAIYSFEPVSRCFADLETTCAAIGAKAVHKAVSDRDGTASINLTTSPECNSLLGYQPYNPCDRYDWIIGEEPVDVCTLDAWCAQNEIDPTSVDLIKLDVQGAELKALSGASRLLQHATMVLAEVAFVPIYKDAPLVGDIDGFMHQAGYRRAAIYPSDQPQHWADALYVRQDQPRR